jgi:protein-tyrosine phosphatase
MEAGGSSEIDGPMEADESVGVGESLPMDEPGLVDLHSHLVPGVDDGARTHEDVLEGVQRLVDRGVGRIITTPHLDGSLTLDPLALSRRLDRVDAAWSEIREAVLKAHPGLVFQKAHEVLLDVPTPDLSDPRLHFPSTSVVLVEWPRLHIPPGTSRVLAGLRDRGIRPLIAHPERYRGFDADLSLVEGWRENGAFLQMNYGSLVGRYGPLARKQALHLLAEGAADCLASDFHGRPHLRLYMRETEALFLEAEAGEAWRLLTRVNPERISRGEGPVPVPAVAFSRGVLDRIRSLFGHRG